MKTVIITTADTLAITTTFASTENSVAYSEAFLVNYTGSLNISELDQLTEELGVDVLVF